MRTGNSGGSNTIENRRVSLTVDARGRIVSLRHRPTRTEWITRPEAAEAWRMIVPTGRHTLDIVYGSQQRPSRIERIGRNGSQAIHLVYDRIQGAAGTLRLDARFILSLSGSDGEIEARIEMENRSARRIDEIEFPVIGGMGIGGLELVAAQDRGMFYGDVLANGLPNTGAASDHYVREHETAMFPSDANGAWLDFSSEQRGLCVGFHARGEAGNFTFKLERFPKGNPHGSAHLYPKTTPRWLRLWGVHVPEIRPGRRWASRTVGILPHAGDWHAGADRYSRYRHEKLKFARPPAWMDRFVGWTEILGKLYTGETFFDFRKCAAEVLRDRRLTGLDLLFYYGHTRLGAEGADFDQSPAPDLGGEKGFRRMLDALHRDGIRVVLLDHLHRYVNADVPQYRRLRLEREAMVNEDGVPRATQYWMKETVLSICHLRGPTPNWVEMCPASGKWLDHYLGQVTQLVERGVDGLELDLFHPYTAFGSGAAYGRCYSKHHRHEPGEDMFAHKLEFVRKVRAHVKRLNPSFVLLGETMVPEAREVVDLFYPLRYLTENDRIFRYQFPSIWQQAVLVGNYACDQVNKAMSLGLGVETEAWGLRRIVSRACPELARYIGEINRFRRRHAPLLIGGTFRDTLGARVRGGALYSVLEGADGSRALVLRNPGRSPLKVEARFTEGSQRNLTLWRPWRNERKLRQLPVTVTLPPGEAAVVLADQR